MNLTDVFRQIDEENALLLELFFMDSLDIDLEPIDIELEQIDINLKPLCLDFS